MNSKQRVWFILTIGVMFGTVLTGMDFTTREAIKAMCWYAVPAAGFILTGIEDD